MYIWISEPGQPLQSYFELYRKFTITKAAEECVMDCLKLKVFIVVKQIIIVDLHNQIQKFSKNIFNYDNFS